MIVEIIPQSGIGTEEPLVLRANQIVIRHEDGTPIACVAAYGPDGAIAVASAAFDPVEFNRMLRVLGINSTVMVSTIQMAKPPAGAVLLSAPNSERKHHGR